MDAKNNFQNGLPDQAQASSDYLDVQHEQDCPQNFWWFYLITKTSPFCQLFPSLLCMWILSETFEMIDFKKFESFWQKSLHLGQNRLIPKISNVFRKYRNFSTRKFLNLTYPSFFHVIVTFWYSKYFTELWFRRNLLCLDRELHQQSNQFSWKWCASYWLNKTQLTNKLIYTKLHDFDTKKRLIHEKHD